MRAPYYALCHTLRIVVKARVTPAQTDFHHVTVELLQSKAKQWYRHKDTFLVHKHDLVPLVEL